MTDSRKVDLDDLGFDAKVLAAAWFGMGPNTTVTLHLRESRPTERTKAALDELVAKNVVEISPFNEFGGLVCRSIQNCSPAFAWFHGAIKDERTAALAKWSITEPIDEDQAYELMTPFGQGIWDKERRGSKPSDNPYDKVAAPEAHASWRKGHRIGTRA